jgi:hypothetical protein
MEGVVLPPSHKDCPFRKFLDTLSVVTNEHAIHNYFLGFLDSE